MARLRSGRPNPLPVGDGLWCGPGAVSGRCRDGLVAAVISGGVGAVVVDAAGFDDATQARAACLRAVIADADEAEVDPVLFEGAQVQPRVAGLG